MQQQFQYSVQVAGNHREEYVAGFATYTDAVNYSDLLAARIHDGSSRQTVNVWNEATDERVYVIYAPVAEAKAASA